MIEIKNKIHEYFKALNFREEGHQYLVEDLPIKISVSGLIKQYKHYTDWDSVRKNVAFKRGISEAEVEAEWKAAADRGCSTGTEAHLFGEDYVYNRSLEPKNGYQMAIKKFWEELPDFIVPLALEVKMYHKEYMFAGTADILLYDTRDGSIHIADYKTNKDLFKSFLGQRMSGPFFHLVCSPYNHYQLQLSYYQILIEQILGIKIKSRTIIWVKPDGEYENYILDDYTEILKNELKLKGI